MSEELKKKHNHSEDEHEHKHEHKHDHDEHSSGCCDHCHHEEKSKAEEIIEKITLVIAVILLACSFIPKFNISEDILRVLAIVFAAYPAVVEAFEGLKEKKVNESFLMVISVLAAMVLSEYTEGALLSILMRAGELLEEFASNRSRKSIESLVSIVNDTGHLVLEDGGTEIIDADDIEVGMKLAVLPHEIFPVDGVIYEGSGLIDTSAITGESIPRIKGEGEEVISGSVNGTATIYIEATAVKAESGAQRIVNMVNEAAENKSKSQNLIESFIRYYTPAVIVIAFAVGILGTLTHGMAWKTWLHNAIVVLMASCPCAIVLSVPLAFLSSMGACAKNGMIIKGSTYIEAVANADTVVFDKTGTLTTEVPVLGDIFATAGYTDDQILSLAAKCEYYSTHPIAKAITAAYGEIDDSEIKDFEEIAGGGVSVNLAEGKVMCGGDRLMKSNNIDVSEFPASPVYVCLDGKAIGSIDINNQIRTSAKPLIDALKSFRIPRLVMLTGDEKSRAEKVCKEIGLNECKANLLPENKLSALKSFKSGEEGKENSIIYVGDGINDAPVLAGADAGIAMGIGTQAACEAADIILTDPDLMRIADTVKQCRKTVSVMKTNIAVSVIIKFVVILLGIIGNIPGTDIGVPIWLAGIADVGTMIICVVNSARLLKVSRYK